MAQAAAFYTSVRAGRQQFRDLPSVLGGLATLLALGMALFHLYTGVTFPLLALQQRSVHLGFVLVLIFLLIPPAERFRSSKLWLAVDVLLAALSVGAMGYMATVDLAQLADMIGLDLRPEQYFFGISAILLLLEATRRTSGLAFCLVIAGFLLFALYGAHIPGPVAFRNVPMDRFVSSMYLTTNGIFSGLLGVSATYVFLFMAFSSFLQHSGAGDYIMRLAFASFGGVRGGPAKVAVVSSGLFGMFSGSPMANVAGTGVITIPLMRKAGYRPEFAGAVEAVASTGGVLMPPVMGSVAFVMAEVLAVPYFRIVEAVALVAILYFAALFIVVDLEAVKLGLRGLPRKELPPFLRTLGDGIHLGLPIAVLVFLMVNENFTTTTAAFWATMAIPVCSWLRRSSRMDWRRILQAFEDTAYHALTVACVMAGAGMITGVLTLTGLGLRLSSLLMLSIHHDE